MSKNLISFNNKKAKISVKSVRDERGDEEKWLLLGEKQKLGSSGWYEVHVVLPKCKFGRSKLKVSLYLELGLMNGPTPTIFHFFNTEIIHQYSIIIDSCINKTLSLFHKNEIDLTPRCCRIRIG